MGLRDPRCEGTLECLAMEHGALCNGAKKDFEFVGRMPGMETIIVTTEGEPLDSSGLKNQLQHISRIK